MKVAIIYDEKYTAFEIHKVNLFFRIFGPTVATLISMGDTQEAALNRARERMFGKTNIVGYENIEKEPHAQPN